MNQWTNQQFNWRSVTIFFQSSNGAQLKETNEKQNIQGPNIQDIILHTQKWCLMSYSIVALSSIVQRCCSLTVWWDHPRLVPLQQKVHNLCMTYTVTYKPVLASTLSKLFQLKIITISSQIPHMCMSIKVCTQQCRPVQWRPEQVVIGRHTAALVWCQHFYHCLIPISHCKVQRGASLIVLPVQQGFGGSSFLQNTRILKIL